MNTIGIVGGTGVTGQWFGRFFKNLGYKVIISGRKLSKARKIAEKNDFIAATSKQLAKQSDAVFFSVPIEETVEAIRKIAPLVRRGRLVSDFTSIKEEPVKAMAASAGNGVEVVGMHPLFGPTIPSIKKQLVVLTPVQKGEWFYWLKNVLQKNGAIVRVTTPRQHDEIMGVVQGLTHFESICAGYALKKIGMPPGKALEYSSPVYRLRFDVMGRIFAQNPLLYAEIQMNNPQVMKAVKKLYEAVTELKEIIEKKDKKKFVKKFVETAKFFGKYKKKTLEESNFLIKQLVEKKQVI